MADYIRTHPYSSDTAYNVSKSGVKTLTEGLQHTLRETPGCKVNAFLLVPGWTITMIGARPPAAAPWLSCPSIDSKQARKKENVLPLLSHICALAANHSEVYGTNVLLCCCASVLLGTKADQRMQGQAWDPNTAQDERSYHLPSNKYRDRICKNIKMTEFCPTILNFLEVES